MEPMDNKTHGVAPKGAAETTNKILGVPDPVKTPSVKEIKDTLATEKEQGKIKKKEASASESSRPIIPAPNQEKVTEANLQKAIQDFQANPWFSPSFLAQFNDVANALLDIQRTIHLKEASNERDVRSRLFELYKSSGALQKELMNNKAQEQLTQAVASFANAAVSGGQFLASMKSMGTAERMVDKKIADQQNKLNNLPKPIQATDSTELSDIQIQQNKDYKTEEKILDNMKASKERDVLDNARILDQQIQSISEAQKQTINGVASVLTSTIHTDSGVKEEMQKILDGFIQSMNKYSETISKSRDDAAANFNRFLDSLMKANESNFKAHLLSGRG
jgi:hypothetical protein